MTRTIAVASLALAVSSAAVPAFAQVTEAGAETVRAGVADAIDKLVRNAMGTVATTAPVTVAVEGDHYALTVPPLTFLATGSRFTGLEAAVTPTPEGWYRVTPVLTSPVLQPTGDMPAGATLGFERQAGTFTYAPAYSAAMAADLSLEGVALTSPYGGPMAIQRLAVTTTSKPVGPDKYDQVTMFTTGGISLEGPGGSWRIGETTLNVTGAAWDLASYGAMQRASDALMAKSGTSGMPALEVYGELWTLFLDFPPLFEDASVSFGLEGLEGSTPDAQVTAASFDTAIALEGVTAGAGTLAFSVEYAGLTVAPLPPSGALLPGDLDVAIALDRVPNADVMAAIRRLREVARQTDLSTALGVMTAEFLPVFLQNEGLALMVSAAGEAPAWDVTVEASFHSDARSPYLIAGTADVTIGRIDDAIAALSADPEAAEPLQALTVLKALGREATDEAGKPVRSYALVMETDGRFTLNGTDISKLF